MKKLLVICGPTATGKTTLAIRLAKKFNGEIVSADSRQVYRGMDIGTGKDLPVNSKFQAPNFKQIQNSKFKIQNYQIGHYLIDGVKIWLYDVVMPDYQFTVADYVECALRVIKDIWRRKKLPILVGGTGFYIKAVVDGVETIGVSPDWELREKLSSLEIKKLGKRLKQLDPKRWEKMNKSDRNNPRRLIRAIEIAVQTQNAKRDFRPADSARRKVATQSRQTQSYSLKPKIDKTLFIGLMVPRAVLYQRIDRRVEQRVKQDIVKEIKGLLKKEYSWEDPGFNTLGYKQWKPFFDGKTTVDEVVKRWKYDEHGYARRQLTWFKKNKRINWFDITKGGFEKKVEKKVAEWYDS